MDDPLPGQSRHLVGASAQNPIEIIPIGRTALGKPSTAAQGRPRTAMAVRLDWPETGDWLQCCGLSWPLVRTEVDLVLVEQGTYRTL
jgi:hypothetical protein